MDNFLSLLGRFREVPDPIARTLAAADANARSPLQSRFREAVQSLPAVKAACGDYSGAEIVIGCPEDITDNQRQSLMSSLEVFRPWRKGPFRLFGTEIDAEWRSDYKWDRILPMLPSLEGKIIGDIGSNNGYFVFRALHHRPAAVFAFDPVPRFYYMFELLNYFAAEENAAFGLLGWQSLPKLPVFFDVLLLMGIVYHHRSPLDVLDAVYRALKPGGVAIIESMGIPGNAGVALFPEGKYAGGSGMYFLPDSVTLQRWLKRSKFREMELFYSAPLSVEEQRRTPWAPVDSLAEFLDPFDSSKTIEGYPAPWRHYFRVVK